MSNDDKHIQNPNNNTDKQTDDYYPEDIKELLRSTHPLKNSETKKADVIGTDGDKMPNDFFERIKELSKQNDSNIDMFETELFGDIDLAEELEQVKKEVAETHRNTQHHKEDTSDDDFEDEYDEDEVVPMDKILKVFNKPKDHQISEEEPSPISNKIYIAALLFVTVSFIAFIVYQNNHIKALTEDLEGKSSALVLLQEQVSQLSDINDSLMEEMATEDTTQSDTDNTLDTQTQANSLPTKYTVVYGDTLTSISRKFYGNNRHVDAIINANNITNPNALKIGLELTIPSID